MPQQRVVSWDWFYNMIRWVHTGTCWCTRCWSIGHCPLVPAILYVSLHTRLSQRVRVRWQHGERARLLQRPVRVDAAEHSQHLHRLPHVRVRAPLLRPHAVVLRRRAAPLRTSGAVRRNNPLTWRSPGNRRRRRDCHWPTTPLHPRLMTSRVLSRDFFVQLMFGGGWRNVCVCDMLAEDISSVKHLTSSTFKVIHTSASMRLKSRQISCSTLIAVILLSRRCLVPVWLATLHFYFTPNYRYCTRVNERNLLLFRLLKQLVCTCMHSLYSMFFYNILLERKYREPENFISCKWTTNR